MSTPSDSYEYGELVLHSGDFKYGSKNNAIYQFDQDIDHHQYFQVHSVILPTTYYVFDTTRTAMLFDGNIVTWAAGNYTASEWIAAVTSQLAGATVTYDPITNKLIFRRVAPFTILFDPANITNPNQNANEELGFSLNVTYNSTLVSGQEQISSEFAVNFSGPNYVYLRSSMACVFNNNHMFFSNTTVTITGGDILCMVPVLENRNSVTYHEDNSGHMLPWQSVGNKRINLYFTLGNRTDVLDFNGHTFQVRIHGYSLKGSGPYKFNY